MNVIAVDMPFSFNEPRWLWLLVLVGVVLLLSVRSLASLGPVRRALALAIRSAVIVAICLTLAQIQRVRRNKNLTVMFLMDRSLSVRDHADAQESYMHEVARKIPPEDRMGVIQFARTAYLEQLPMTGGYFLERGRLPEMANPGRTNVAGAIRLAMAMFPHDTAKRIVLMTDGNDNMGDVLSEARRAKADGIVIDVVPLQHRATNEVYFDKMIAPTTAQAGEVVPIRMNIHSNRVASGRIVVYHNGAQVALRPEIAHQTLRAGNNSFVLKLPIQSDGVQRFEAKFIPDDRGMDTTIENNRATAFSFVSGKGKVAILTLKPSFDEALLDALKSEKIDARMIDIANDVPDLAQLTDYAAIILANVPANAFTDEQQRMLASYVEDSGGGLIMTGGDDSFGAGGWIGTPVAAVLPVELEIKHKRIIPRGALALIMHSCEFPRGNAWGKLVAKKAVATVSSRDYIGLLSYAASGEGWTVPLQLAGSKRSVQGAIDRMYIGDMPDFDTTMKLAVQGLSATDAAQKHMIIISDGDPNPPTARVLQSMIAAKITCSAVCVGYGQHTNESSLRRIAKKTGGRFYAVRNPRKLPQIFVKESKIVRRPLIIDEPFKPQVYYSLSDLLAGVRQGESIPSLGGLVLTSPRKLAQIALVRATTDGRDPVLAHWQRGLGRVVAFTSGYWPKWGTAWTQWAKFSKLWAQIVRWSMRQDAPSNFDTYTTVEGNKGRIVIEALDSNADYLNFLNLRARLIHSDEEAKTLQFTQTGPGHYEATFDIERTGQYIANIAVNQDGEYIGSIHSGVSVPFSPELRELATNEPLLEDIADTTRGRVLAMDADTDGVFDHDLPPTLSRQPAWNWMLAWLLLPLFLLDVSCRRLANWLAFSIVCEVLLDVVVLFGLGVIHTTWWGVLGALLLGELIGWSIRFRYIGLLFDWLTHTVVTLGRTGERATASLAQLKSVKDRVRDGQPPDLTKTAMTSQPDADETAADRKARFEAGDGGTGDSEKSMDELLGGAKATSTGPKKPKSASKETKDADEPKEATTSRLLRAKRRTQKDKDDTNA